MKIIGIMPARNESWVLGLSARVALKWCDFLIVMNHASTDESSAILRVIGKEDPRIIVIDEPRLKWDEMQYRQIMLDLARDGMSATHIGLVDADEILSGNLLSTIRNYLASLPHGQIFYPPGYNLRGGIDKYHASGIWANRWFSCVFHADPGLGWQGDQWHHREPFGIPRNAPMYRPIGQHQGGIMHLWGASERRLRAKHAWYKVTERLLWPKKSVGEIDRMYSWAVHGQTGDTPKEWQFRAVPGTWWHPYEDLMQYLQVDAEPWQEAEVRRIVAEHGPAMFAGLDLFGVSEAIPSSAAQT